MKREKNYDDEKGHGFEQDRHIDEDKKFKERPIGTNSDEQKANKIVHWKVEGEALPTPEEFAPWYPKEEEKHRNP